MKTKYLFLFVLSWLMLFMLALKQVEEFTTLEALVIWLVMGGGGMALFGYVESYLLENWPAWHTFPFWVKASTPIVFAGLVGIIGQIVLQLDLLLYVPSWLQMLILAAANYIFNQKAYKGIKDTSYGATARNGASAVG